jgi:hypothetical protein
VHLIERVRRRLADQLRNHWRWAALPAPERATSVLLDGRWTECHRPGRGIRLVHTLCKGG